MGLRTTFRRQTTDGAVTQVEVSTTENKKQDTVTDGAAAENNVSDTEERTMEMPEEDVQRGVKDMEAMTQSWSKWALIAVFMKYGLPFPLPTGSGHRI